MEQDLDLSGKTFDQQVQAGGDGVLTRDISPNRRIPAEVVFEPMGSGVRVTARDEQHRVLWGYVGSKETRDKNHAEVAVYPTLQELLTQELVNRGLFTPEETTDPLSVAIAALAKLQVTVKWLRDSLEVKTETEATRGRAQAIARIVAGAEQFIAIDSDGLKGMKPRPKSVADATTVRQGNPTPEQP